MPSCPNCDAPEMIDTPPQYPEEPHLRVCPDCGYEEQV